MARIRHGRERTWKTEKDYQNHVRKQVLGGMINMPDGQWVDNSRTKACEESKARCSYAGVRGKKFKWEEKGKK